jgi:uncharacterized cupredoxin-like copper-binding protein
MHKPRKLLLVVALLAIIGLVTACGDDGDDTGAGGAAAADAGDDGGLASSAPDVQTLDVTVPGGEGGEFAFETSPATLSAGPVEISITNHGELEHQAMVMRFDDGADFAAFAAAAASDPTGVAALDLVEGFGGPNGAAPGETRSTTQVLEAGDYMLICVLPGEDGLPHASHGMVMPFTVTEGDTELDATTPTGVDADVDVRLIDYAFDVAGPLQAGETVHVVNDGDQAHELVVYKLDEGATVDDFTAAMENPTGPPPATSGGGIGALSPGRAVDVTLPDEPGDYVLFCMLPDAAGSGLPHIAHGMVAGAEIG